MGKNGRTNTILILHKSPTAVGEIVNTKTGDENNDDCGVVSSQIYAKFVTNKRPDMKPKTNRTASISTDKRILDKIKSLKRGRILFPELFTGIGSPDAIRQSLHRLVKSGVIIRLAQGIYVYPKQDKILGTIHPAVEDIAKAIAKRDKARIVPTGSYALNKLGLSTQVPMNVVYLTDGAPRVIKINKQSIRFKKASPKNLMAKGEISGLVIQALRAIGNDKVTSEELKKISLILKKESSINIVHDASIAPAWIAKILMASISNTQF